MLAIYFSALALLTFVPAKVVSIPFINLAQSVQFEIDPSSPAMSVEKDFYGIQKRLELQTGKPSFSLNEVVGKPQSQFRNLAVAPQVPKPRQPILDYSQKVRADTLSNLTISGPLELKQGLALTDEHRIEVHRESKGAVVEYGDVDISKGTYAIKLSSAEGHVCARLRGSRYEIIGEGCFSLDRIRGLNKSTNAGPLLSVSRYKDVLAFSDKPTSPPPAKEASEETEKVVKANHPERRRSPVVDARIIDFYDSDNPDAKPLDVNFENSVQNAEDTNSTIVTVITSKDHPPARIVANHYSGNSGASLPNRNALDALEKLAREAGHIPPGASGGTAWGRAKSEGRSVAGAQVEIEGREDLRPLYLNEFYIPDVNQKSTASHGLYTFVGLPEGEYSIRGTQGNKFMGFQNISVRENALALADIDATDRKRPVRVAVYDLLNKTSQDAVATLQNYDEDIVIQGGQVDINVQDNFDTAFALVNPLSKKYMTAQHILNPDDELYTFPLVPSQWVETVLAQAKLERPVKNKIILGIGAQKPFRVEAIGSKLAQIVYFDSEGQVVEGNFGSAGGGFFILDPEDHVTEYAIQAAGEKSVRAVYMPTVPNILNIIQL